MTVVNKLITDNIDVWTSAIKKRNATGRGSNKKIELAGIKKLRELIFELAVRGKLVPQHADDEPACVLLERIAEEKTQLIADKKIKKQKVLPAITEEEKPFELPNDWEWDKLGNLSSDIHYGYTASAKHDCDGVRLLRITDIQNDKVDWHTVPACDISSARALSYSLVNDDILIARTGGTIGKSYLVENIDLQAVFASYLIRVKRISAMYAPFIKTYLGSQLYWGQLYDNASGTGQPNVNATALKGLAIPIPPLGEQQRIVTKVDELMALCDQLEQQTEESLSAHQTLVEVLLATLTESNSAEDFQTSWQRIAEHFDLLFTTEHSIEQLKKTILQLAVMGKLVPQNPSDEPASVLLEKIAEVKAQLIANKKIKKQKPLLSITDEEKPFDLPSSWEWCNLGVLTTIRGGKRLPKGQQLTTEKTPYIYIRVTDMRNGSVREDDLHYLSEEIQSQISKYIITKDDIYMTIVGATIGKCGLVPAKFDGMNLTENAARITPFYGIDKTYLFKCLDSSFAQKQFFDQTNQVGVQKMALIRLAGTKIPFPPLAEQQRIVAKVDELMLLCDQLKTRLADAQTTQLHLADAVVENALSAHTTNT